MVLWETGLVAYAVPLVMFCLGTGLLWRGQGKRSGWTRLFALALVALVSGGFSPTQLAAQMALVIATIAARGRGTLTGADRRAIVAVAVGTIGAAILVVVASGNAVRAGLLHINHPSPGPLWALARAGVAALWYSFLMLTSATLAGLTAILAACSAGLLGMEAPRLSAREAFAEMCVAFFALTAAAFPAAYVYGGSPPARARLVMNFIVVAAAGVGSLVVGARIRTVLRPALRLRVALVLVSLAVIAPIWTFAQAPRAEVLRQEWAKHWDERDARFLRLREAGNREATFTPPPEGFKGDIAEGNSDFWTNDCIAGYYGFDRVRATLPSLPVRLQDRNQQVVPRRR